MKKLATDKRDGWYEITPLDAAKLLDGRPTNRPVSSLMVKRYSSSIQAGEWARNGETIVLDGKGKPLDGQTRLSAIMAAQKPIVSYVVHLNGVSHVAAFDTMNQGRKRSFGERLSIEGVEHYNLSAAVAAKIMEYDEGTFSGKRKQHKGLRQARLFFARNSAEIKEAIDLVNLHTPRKGALLPRSLSGVICFLATRCNREKGREFTEKLLTGDNIPATSPVSVLRKRLIENLCGATKLTGRARWALIVKAWLLFLDDKKAPRVLGWREKEGMPRFEGKE